MNAENSSVSPCSPDRVISSVTRHASDGIGGVGEISCLYCVCCVHVRLCVHTVYVFMYVSVSAYCVCACVHVYLRVHTVSVSDVETGGVDFAG